MLPLLALRIDIKECYDCSFSLKTFLKRRTNSQSNASKSINIDFRQTRKCYFMTRSVFVNYLIAFCL